MNQWCTANYAVGNCPGDKCKCAGAVAKSSPSPAPGAKKTSLVAPDIDPDDYVAQRDADQKAKDAEIEKQWAKEAVAVAPTDGKSAATDGCTAYVALDGTESMDQFCSTNCAMGNCPADKCKCAGAAAKASQSPAPQLSKTAALAAKAASSWREARSRRPT